MEAKELLAKMGKISSMAAESVKENTIGRHVCEVIARTHACSLADLVASLQDEIDHSQSARGKGSPELDIRRLAAEAALKHLRTLLPPGAA